MNFAALAPYIPTVLGGLRTLLQPDPDPYGPMREQMERILAQMEADLPKMRSGIRSRGEQRFEQIARILSDRGAAGGLPRNVIDQNIMRAKIGQDRLTEEALGQFDMAKQSQLGRIAGMYGAVPTKPQSTWGPDLMMLGLNWLLRNQWGSPVQAAGGFQPAQQGQLPVFNLPAVQPPMPRIPIPPETEILPSLLP